MVILDLDLDFFISDIAHFSGKDRLEDNYQSWDEVEFRGFLERKCNLSKKHVVKGCVVEKHHGVFFACRELIDKGEIDIPFELYHVDAHSDFGLGDSGWTEIVYDIVHRDVNDRRYPKKLSEGNYVTYLIANRWISKLNFIAHPKWNCDYIQLHMKDCDDNAKFIQLKGFQKDSNSSYTNLLKTEPMIIEPEIKFEQFEDDSFLLDEKPDFVFLSQSPSYTPKSADKLIEIFKEYIIEMDFENDIFKI